jgi:hypothetical protein
VKEIQDKSWRWNELPRGREFHVDDLEGDARIRLRLRGEDEASEVEASVELDSDWLLLQRFHRHKGAWVAVGKPELRHPDDPKREAGARMRKRTIDRHVPRINQLLRDALRIDDSLHEVPQWRTVIAGRWRMSEIRSRRGGKRELDPDEIGARLAKGGDFDTLPRIAAELGNYHPQSLKNTRHRAKRRSLTEPEES